MYSVFSYVKLNFVSLISHHCRACSHVASFSLYRTTKWRVQLNKLSFVSLALHHCRTCSDVKISSVRFSSRWYLCAGKIRYALRPVSQKFPQSCFCQHHKDCITSLCGMFTLRHVLRHVHFTACSLYGMFYGMFTLRHVLRHVQLHFTSKQHGNLRASS